MTDEERQKLIAKLRWYGDRMERELSSPMREAADEIERLAKELLITEGALEICQGELNLAFDRIQRHD